MKKHNIHTIFIALALSICFSSPMSVIAVDATTNPTNTTTGLTTPTISSPTITNPLSPAGGTAPSNPATTYQGIDYLAPTLNTPITTPPTPPAPSSKDINEEFRKNAKVQIDSTLDMLRPSNAPDILPNSFKDQVIADKNNAGIPALLSYVAGIFASIAGLLSMIYILFNSYQYIASKGDPTKTAKAIKGITWSLIGLVGIIFSYNIVYSVIRLVFEQVANGGV